MLYHLIDWLRDMGVKFPGDALFQFITSRVLLAVILSLIISALFGKQLINYLLKKQVGESVRDLGLAGEPGQLGKVPPLGQTPSLVLADEATPPMFSTLTEIGRAHV